MPSLEENTMSKKKAAQTSVRLPAGKGDALLSAEERAAMRETLNERRRARSGKVDGESDVLAKIAEMAKPDRVMAERIHAIVKAKAPTLSPKTWYGMPAYAKDGKVICLCQSEGKFKSSSARSAFQQDANFDEGALWAPSFAFNSLTPAI